MLYQHCADAGRDPGEILPSSQVRFTGDPAETAARLVIAYLRPPYTPAVPEPLARALSELP